MEIYKDPLELLQFTFDCKKVKWERHERISQTKVKIMDDQGNDVSKDMLLTFERLRRCVTVFIRGGEQSQQYKVVCKMLGSKGTITENWMWLKIREA